MNGLETVGLVAAVTFGIVTTIVFLGVLFGLYWNDIKPLFKWAYKKGMAWRKKWQKKDIQH